LIIAALARQSRNHQSSIINPQWIINLKFQIINA